MERQYWLNKLKARGRIVIHPTHNCRWIKVWLYWNKYRVETSWHDDTWFDTAEAAIDKVVQLVNV